MSRPFITGANPCERMVLKRRADQVRSEIALAKQRLNSVQAGIDNRQKALARLEAQLAMTSSASPSSSQSAD